MRRSTCGPISTRQTSRMGVRSTAWYAASAPNARASEDAINRCMDRRCTHPVVDAYRNYMRMPYDRPSWDLTAALYAVRPEASYFTLSPNGTVRVDEKGNTLFTPSTEGKHRYMVLDETRKARTLEALILLASQPR
jgi:hypothetical protein